MGLPAHPLFVHIPVVLVPLAAVGVVIMVAKPAWWERYKWATLAVAGAGMIGAVVAAGTGEELEEVVEDTSSRALLRAHEEAGETARAVSSLLFIVLLVAVVVPWWLRRRATGSTSVEPPRWLRVSMSVVLVVTAIGASWSVYDAGHTGAKSVWSDVKVGSGDNGDNAGEDDKNHRDDD